MRRGVWTSRFFLCLFEVYPFEFFEGLEQTRDVTVGINVDIFSCGVRGKTGHGVDFSGEGNNETGTGAQADICDWKDIFTWCTQTFFIMRD